MELRTVVTQLLDGGLTHGELANQVPCSSSLISMLASGERGKQTTYAIEVRLRDLHAAMEWNAAEAARGKVTPN